MAVSNLTFEPLNLHTLYTALRSVVGLAGQAQSRVGRLEWIGLTRVDPGHCDCDPVGVHSMEGVGAAHKWLYLTPLHLTQPHANLTPLYSALITYALISFLNWDVCILMSSFIDAFSMVLYVSLLFHFVLFVYPASMTSCLMNSSTLT